MPFSVQAFIDDHRLSVTTETAKDAFAKAVEWHVAERLSNVTISDGNKSYTISEFASVMALRQIADTVEADVVRDIVVAKRVDLAEAAAELIDVANQNGGRDNISVVLLRVPADWVPVVRALWVCALYIGVPLGAGYFVFLRRDVAGE